jgi:HYDIN/CFA65/VesB-like, Ig-like domain/Abnormal spindle-like microcephaly-assoc'd, ASPM-SPD-2-Hydin
MKIPGLPSSNRQPGNRRRLPDQSSGFDSATRHVILAALLITAAFCLGSQPSWAGGRLALSPEYVNFGNVDLKSSRTVTITIKNTGDGPVMFRGDSLTAASQFTMSGFVMPFTLGAERSMTFTLRFSPTALGAKSGTLTLLSNATNERVVMWMNGSGVEVAVSATPPSTRFGNVVVGVSNSQTIQLKNAGTLGLMISTAGVSGAGFSVSGVRLPLYLPVGKTATVNIAFEPKTAGAVTGSASIQGDFPTVTVPVSGTGIPDSRVISATATSEHFGNVNVGSSSTATFTLTDTGNSSVTISGLSCSGAGVSASGAVNVTLDPGQSTPVTVKFAPTKSGAVSGSVAVTSNASDSPFAIAVSGSGVSTATRSVNLHWAASSSTNVTGYDVYRSTVSGGPYTKLDSAPVAALDYTDSTVRSGTEYFYVVTSVESSGAQSNYSSQISISVP